MKMHKQIIFCNCGGNLIDPKKMVAVDEFIAGLGIDFVKVSDLCGLCSVNKEEAVLLFSSSDETLILACYPRAMKMLIKYADEGSTGKFSFINMVDSDRDSLMYRIRDFVSDSTQVSSIRELHSDLTWPAWFPLIDYSRCNFCGQCAEFCLFGVLEKTHDKVLVVQPKACKNNCPACARICPKTAIVFPKYLTGGAIAGADTIDESAEQERQHKDSEMILGNDIYTTLQQRKLKRRSIITEEAMRKALEEREGAFKENKTNP
jgi:NAD-dependent dihydropyrimidine dehydrogenase PreA subunit